MFATTPSLQEFEAHLRQVREEPGVICYDPLLLGQLSPNAQTRALALLAELIAVHDDVRAIHTVANAGLRDLLPVVTTCRTEGDSWARAAAAVALNHLLNVPPTNSPLSYEIEPLVQAIASGGVGMRSRSFLGLVLQMDLRNLLRPIQGPLGRLRLACLTNLSSVRVHAARELRDIAMAVDGGATPDSLLLRYRPEPDQEAAIKDFQFAFERSGRVDIAAVRSMDPAARRWAETILLTRLAWSDRRSPEALYALEVPCLTAHLRCAIEESHPENPDTVSFQRDCRQVLERLEQPPGDQSAR